MKGEFNIYSSIIKPLFDFVFSLFLILLLLPILLPLLLVLGIHFKGNPIYIQKRIGWKNQSFYLLKLRTYKEQGNRSSITKLGALIRKSSLDELPQLINILSGKMSFIGPRPLLPEYIPFYSENEVRRHEVKPGLSGLSQIEIGNSSDWDGRLAKDIEYVEKQSLMLDLRILLKTIVQFLFTKGSDIEIARFDHYAQNR